jgi:hypothetical protein
MPPPPERPPVFTLLCELLDWTLERTATVPKCHRFTIGQRLDGFTLDALERCVEAIFAPPQAKRVPLAALNLLLEKLRIFWRITCGRGWISRQQMLFVAGKIDEIGRMTGGWLASLEKRK